MIVKKFHSPEELAGEFAEELLRKIQDSAGKKKTFTLALSGGSTPELLFSYLATRYSKFSAWKFVHLFWGDERCVPPESTESNYGMTKKALIDKIDIPSDNIHRIRGEEDPDKEAGRYSGEISDFAAEDNGLPQFDLIILGLGEDGHTASIFPGHPELFDSEKICATAAHPVTGQRRITLTGRVINNASEVVFLVAGKRKAEIVGRIFKKSQPYLNFPATHIVPVSGSLTWFLDEEAGSLL